MNFFHNPSSPPGFSFFSAVAHPLLSVGLSCPSEVTGPRLKGK
jgi:hypothetical protein